MSLNDFAQYLGYGVMIVFGTAAVALAGIFSAALINDAATGLYKAAMNTYWWSRWLRWHRIARARKAARKEKAQ